ncbi:MAG: helical backbone metal receptor, partial [Flavobacteriaceae bacterium]|nr:helical backbone metal receptor [Flavobacteriaceae bacterium]
LRTTKSIVGGTKNLHFDRIKALQPDFILTNKEENTPEIVRFCQSLAPTYTSDIADLEDLINLIKDLKRLCAIPLKADELIEKLQHKFQELADYAVQAPQIPVAYIIWKNPLMVAASQTFIHFLLEASGFKNVFKPLQRYPEISLKQLQEVQPEVVMLSSEPFPFKQKDCTAFSPLNAMVVDGEYCSWYGSRLLKSLDYLQQLHRRLSSNR